MGWTMYSPIRRDYTIFKDFISFTNSVSGTIDYLRLQLGVDLTFNGCVPPLHVDISHLCTYIDMNNVVMLAIGIMYLDTITFQNGKICRLQDSTKIRYCSECIMASEFQ